MTGLKTSAVAAIAGCLTLPGAYTHDRIARVEAFAQRGTSSAYAYRVTVTKQETGYNGKTSTPKPLILQTVIAGRGARVEVIEGDKELKTGDLLLTADGGETINWISGKKREYRVIDAAYAQKLTGDIASKMKLQISNSRVEAAPSRADGKIEAQAVTHAQVSRSCTLTVRVLMMTYTVDFEDTLDVWVAKDLAGPGVEARFFETFINAFLFSDDAMRGESDRARASRPAGLPLKWSHVSRSRKPDGATEEKTTTFVVSDIDTRADANVGFDVPEGYRRVEK